MPKRVRRTQSAILMPDADAGAGDSSVGGPAPPSHLSFSAESGGGGGSSLTLESPLSAQGPSQDGTFVRTYDDVEIMGEGAFGVVLSARNRVDNRRYAVKRIPFYFQAHEVFDLERLRKQCLREAKVLAALDHPHVVRYYQSWVERVGLVRCDPDEIEAEELTPRPEEVAVAAAAAATKGQEQDEQEQEQDDDDDDDAVYFGGAGDDSAQSWWADLDLDLAPALSDEIAQMPPRSNSTNTASAKDPPTRQRTAKDGKALFLRIDLFIVMKLYDRSMKRWLEYRRASDIDPRQNLVLLQQLLMAVEYIHARGVVHRDVSPCNLFFSAAAAEDETNKIILGDFGLASADAKWRSLFRADRRAALTAAAAAGGADDGPRPPRGPRALSSSSLSESFYLPAATVSSASPPPPRSAPRHAMAGRAGDPVGALRRQHQARPISRVPTALGLAQTLQEQQIGAPLAEDEQIGKPLYASPEQWGAGGQTGAKADIFSLGVIWVEMHCHFRTGRERIEVLNAARRGDLPASLDCEVARLARRMLAVDPEARATAAELLADPAFAAAGMGGSPGSARAAGGRKSLRCGDEAGRLLHRPQQGGDAAAAAAAAAAGEVARLRRRVAELSWQNLALRRLLRE